MGEGTAPIAGVADVVALAGNEEGSILHATMKALGDRVGRTASATEVVTCEHFSEFPHQ